MTMTSRRFPRHCVAPSRLRCAWFVVLAALASTLAACGHGPPKSPTKPAAVQVVPGQLDGRRWLSEEAALAESLGAGPLQIAVTDVAGDGDRVGGFVALPPDTCVLAYARGSRGIEDLDLYAYGDDGTTLGADEATDPAPAVVICPPHPSRAYFVVRVAAGRGIVSIGVHSVSPSVAARAGKALGARGRPGEELGRIEAWPGLDERIGAHRRAVGARWEEVRRVAIQADARAATRLSASLEGGRCLDVYVIPGEDFAQLDVTVLDSDDRVLVRAPSTGGERTAIVCSPVKLSLSIEIRPHAGQGLCAVILARSDVGAERIIAAPAYAYRVAPVADLAIERAERAKALSALGYEPPINVGRGTADVGRRLSFPVQFPDGCVRFEVVGGRPLSGVTAEAWDAASNLVASGSAGDSVALFVCGGAGKGRIDVEAQNRPGPFLVEMRKERASSPLLVAHPLAASRLLGALGASGEPMGAKVRDRYQAVPARSHLAAELRFRAPRRALRRHGGCAGSRRGRARPTHRRRPERRGIFDCSRQRSGLDQSLCRRARALVSR